MGTRKRGAGLLAATVAATLAGVLIAAGGASTSSKEYEAAVAPASVAAGTTTTIELTLRNDASSRQSLGSANVTVPAGFAVDASSFAQTPPAGKTWHAPVLRGGTIELRAVSSKDSVDAGAALVVAFEATVSCSAPTPATWPTQVKQSNDFLGTGNDFVGNSPVTAIAHALASFELDPISSPQAVGTPIAVRAVARDACGDVATDYDGSATIGGLTSVATGSLAFTDGIATGSVTPAAAQAGAQLTVADGAVSATSNAFDVVDRLCRADDPAGVCEASDALGATTVTTPLPPSGGTMALRFDTSAALSCAGGDLALRGSLATIDPVGYVEPIPVTLRWDKSVAPGTGVANFVLCMSKDGVAFAVAPRCTKAGTLPAGAAFCELKRNRNGVGDLVVEVLLHPTDPIAGLG